MAVQKLGQSTLETTQDKFKPNFTTCYATPKNKKNKQTNNWAWESGRVREGGGGGGVEGGGGEQCAPPMNECLGVLLKKMSLPTH